MDNDYKPRSCDSACLHVLYAFAQETAPLNCPHLVTVLTSLPEVA